MNERWLEEKIYLHRFQKLEEDIASPSDILGSDAAFNQIHLLEMKRRVLEKVVSMKSRVNKRLQYLNEIL